MEALLSQYRQSLEIFPADAWVLSDMAKKMMEITKTYVERQGSLLFILLRSVSPSGKCAKLYSSGAQTVARKALWSGPRSNFHWKENLTL